MAYETLIVEREEGFAVVTLKPPANASQLVLDSGGGIHPTRDYGRQSSGARRIFWGGHRERVQRRTGEDLGVPPARPRSCRIETPQAGDRGDPGARWAGVRSRWPAPA
jgi:hypothetical protein